MLSKSKTEARNSNHPPVLPSASSTNTLIVKQSRKQKMAAIKRSLTFEQTGGNTKLCHTSNSLSPPPSMPTTALQLQCTNQCVKQIFAFAYLLRTNPPRLPDGIFNDLNLIKLSSVPQSAATALASPASRRSTVISRSNVNSSLTGKVKVIVCVNQTCNNSSSSQGLAMVASTALKTVGGLLPTNHPLSTIHPKVDRNSLSPPTSSSPSSSLPTNCVEIDQYHKTITLLDPTPSRRRNGGHSKMYKFDDIITQDTLKPELCSIVLKDAIASVLNGKDSCILTIGHKATGKTHSMLGYDYCSTECGIIPYAISWLYQLLNYQKYYCNTRFSIRISAVEIFGLNEEFRDLLANTAASCDEEYSDQSPSHYLQTPTDQNKPSSCDKKSSGTASTNTTTPNTKYYDKSQSISAKMIDRLSHLCELRASSAEKAAYLLDTALSNRSVHTCDQLSGLSHMLFTIHLYQCKLENNHDEMTISGGRTKLHFLDLGCGRYGQHLISLNKRHSNSSSSLPSAATMAEAVGSPPVSSPSPSSSSSPGQNAENCTTSKALSLSGIGCVLLALLTGRRQLPFNDSSLTYLLREAVSGNQIQPCILAHISSNVQYYTETLQVIQLATEINRLRRRKVGINHTGTLSSKDNYNINNNNNINSLPMHHNSDRSQDDTGSSSVDTETGYIRTRRSLYSRRPRLGRLSYARSLGSSCSSEVDCTSSGEQTCDTVIYVGDSNKTSLKPVHRYSNGSQLSINELGPRGLADGSVDVHSVNYRSHRGSAESVMMMTTSVMNRDDEQSIMKRQYSGNHNRSVNPGHSNNSSTVKRMIPRTNATAWPRIINLRRSRKLSTSLSPTSLSSATEGATNITITEETWIDGPNASMTPPTPTTPTYNRNTINNEQNLVNLTPSEENIKKNDGNCSSAPTSTPTPTPTSAPPPPPPSYHNCVHNLIQDNLTTSFICNIEEVCEQLKEEPIMNSIQTQTSSIPHMINIYNASNSMNAQLRNTTAPPHPTTTATKTTTTTENNFISSNSSGSSNSSTCSTLESNQHRKVPRALSDISERTEDAETLQESNSSSRQLNLNLSHECLTTIATTTSFLTSSQLFSFDEKTFCSNPFLSNDNYQKFMDNNNKNSNNNNNLVSCSVNTSTKPTEVLLDIGRQIREASKCNNYMIPTSYMSVVNVPQYLNCLNEDEELMSNLKITSTTIPTTTNNNNKSPLFNHDELKQHSTITENLGTTRDDITLSNSHQINSLSSIKPTDNNDGGSIKRTVSFNESISIPTVSQCQNQQIKTQRTASQSRKQASKMRSAEKSQEVSSSILNSNNNNNNNVTNVIASTTATNISSNSSLFRVAQWINSITPLYSTDQSVQCFNVNNYSACTANTISNKCDHSVNNSKHHCLNSANQTIHSYLNNADKNNNKNNNNSNDVHYSVYSTTMAGATPATTVVITTPSTLNDSAIGSLKCTKQNGLSKNQSCMAKICENKQTFPLYSSSPVVPPPSLLSSHNDTTPLGYPFYSMTSDGICQIPQSHSTPVFISPQETAISPSNHNNNCNNNNNNNNNSHPPYTNQPTSPPSANVSDLYTHQLTTDNNLVGTRNYEAGERLDGLRNQMALANPHNSPAYYPYYQYYYYHYQNQQCDPDQICFNNNNNNSTDEMTPKQAFYPPTSLCQPDQLTQIKLAHNLNIGQIHENCNPNEPNAYHNNNEEEEEHGGEAMDRPSEKLKMKLSLKFLTLPLFRNFRLRRKEKKRNSGKANRTTDKEDNKSSISVTRNGDVEQVEEDDDRSVKPSPILHSLSLPVKLTTFGYQPVEGNNNNNNTAKPNNLSCTDNCCHCEHSQYLRDHQQRQQRQLPSPPSIPAPPTPTLGPHSQTSFSPLHGYRHHSSISSRLPPNHHHHHHHHQTSRQFNSHLWSQHCTENVETPIINYCNKHLPHSYSLQNNGSFLNQRNDVNFSLSNSPSTGFNAASGKLSASVCRSTRRSMHITGSGGGGGCGGGPSSSGYESMRTGASELSLSHQDSASDCSGQCKDILLSRRSSLDGYRQRCNSHHHQHHQHQHHSHHLHVQSHSSSHQSQQYDHRSSYQQNNQQHLMINNQS